MFILFVYLCGKYHPNDVSNVCYFICFPLSIVFPGGGTKVFGTQTGIGRSAAYMFEYAKEVRSENVNLYTNLIISSIFNSFYFILLYLICILSQAR